MNIRDVRFKGLTGNQLKIIALIAMTCDHVGKQILPEYTWLQIIGRLTFPIFAYMIAEGCRYTKNRKKYLLTIMALALACQIVYYIAMGSLYQCVLVTFAMSIGLIYIVDNAMKKKSVVLWVFAVIFLFGVYFICEKLPMILSHTDFMIDYGFWGIMLSLMVYVGKTKKQKLLHATTGLILLAFSLGGIQWYSLSAILLLALYSGKRGKMKLKNLFYIYYPIHLLVIYFISVLLDT